MTRCYYRKSQDSICVDRTGTGIKYRFHAYPGNNDFLTVERENKSNTVKIVDDFQWYFKVQKTQIKARGGATGLFKFIDNCLSEEFMEIYAWRVLDAVIDEVKLAK